VLDSHNQCTSWRRLAHGHDPESYSRGIRLLCQWSELSEMSRRALWSVQLTLCCVRRQRKLTKRKYSCPTIRHSAVRSRLDHSLVVPRQSPTAYQRSLVPAVVSDNASGGMTPSKRQASQLPMSIPNPFSQRSCFTTHARHNNLRLLLVALTGWLSCLFFRTTRSPSARAQSPCCA
jgi:hypothetical protein